MFRTLAFAAAVLLVSVAPTHAALILGNLPGNNGNLNNIGQGLTASVGFTMTDAYTLSNAQLSLRLNTPTDNGPSFRLPGGVAPASPSDNAPELRLTSDLAGNNTLLTFVTPSSLPTGDNVITFGAPSAYTLQAGTTYYLTLGSSNSGGAYFNWLGNNPPATLTGPGATYTAFRPSQDGYAGPLSFAVNGTPVVALPEPAGVAMLAAGLPCLATVSAWGRRRLGVAA